jgi:hypothetical protein
MITSGTTSILSCISHASPFAALFGRFAIPRYAGNAKEQGWDPGRHGHATLSRGLID